MAGINFRTTTKYAAITGNSASTSSNPNNATLIFTCPNNYEAEIVFLRIANNQTTAETIGIQVYVSEDTAYNDVVKTEQISASSSKQFIDAGPLFLHEGDKLLIYRNDSTKTFNAVVSARLYYTPARRT